jgi:hypothetical protein
MRSPTRTGWGKRFAAKLTRSIPGGAASCATAAAAHNKASASAPLRKFHPYVISSEMIIHPDFG